MSVTVMMVFYLICETVLCSQSAVSDRYHQFPPTENRLVPIDHIKTDTIGCASHCSRSAHDDNNNSKDGRTNIVLCVGFRFESKLCVLYGQGVQMEKPAKLDNIFLLRGVVFQSSREKAQSTNREDLAPKEKDQPISKITYKPTIMAHTEHTKSEHTTDKQHSNSKKTIQSKDESHPVEVNNADVTILPGDIQFGKNCSKGQTATFQDGDCYKGVWQCKTGYSFDMRNNRCVEKCAEYGKNFTKLKWTAIKECNVQMHMVATTEECLEACVNADFVCKNCEFKWELKRLRACYLCNETWAETDDDRKWVGRAHFFNIYFRHCKW